MNKQHLSEQIGSLLAVYYLTLEAANLMQSKIDLMMFQDNKTFTHEAKLAQSRLKKGMGAIRLALDYFEINVLPVLSTDDGKTDGTSVSTAFLNNANQIVRMICEAYNNNRGNTAIDEDIINYFIPK